MSLCGSALALVSAVVITMAASGDGRFHPAALSAAVTPSRGAARPLLVTPPDTAPRLAREDAGYSTGEPTVTVRVNRAAKGDLAMTIIQKLPTPEPVAGEAAPAETAMARILDDGATALKRGFLRKLPVIIARHDLQAPLSQAAHAERLKPGPARLADLSIVSGKDLEKAHACLTQAIYHESRGEPVRGQQAVAQVVLNRVKSGVYPASICGVIFQNKHWRNRCQFSFACDGTNKRVNDQEAWETATRIADDAIAGRYFLQEIGDATHYHAAYVAPRWRRSLQRMKKIGEHIFYAIPGVAINDE